MVLIINFVLLQGCSSCYYYVCNPATLCIRQHSRICVHLFFFIEYDDNEHYGRLHYAILSCKRSQFRVDLTAAVSRRCRRPKLVHAVAAANNLVVHAESAAIEERRQCRRIVCDSLDFSADV